MFRHRINALVVASVIVAGCAAHIAEEVVTASQPERASSAATRAFPQTRPTTRAGYSGGGAVARASSAATAMCGVPPAPCGPGTSACCKGSVCSNDRICVSIGPPSQPPPIGGFPPPRPTYSDVSDRMFRSGLSGNVNRRGQPFLVYQNHTASQPERDQMQQFLTRVALPEAIRFARTLPSCKPDVAFAVNGVTVVMARLATNYELKSICPRGDWLVGPQGRHYNTPNYALAKLRACVLSTPEACAASPLLTLGMQDLLDIVPVNGRCQGRPVTAQPSIAFDPVRANDGTMSTRADLTKPLSEAQLKLLDTADMAHGWATDFANGDRPDPPPPSFTSKAHDEFTASCGKASGEAGVHKCQAIPFSGAMDSTWSKDQQRALRTMQHIAHHGWSGALKTGDWCAIRGFDENHSIAHVCAALNDPRLEVRPYRPECIESCAVVTCQQLVDAFMQTPGSPPM